MSESSRKQSEVSWKKSWPKEAAWPAPTEWSFAYDEDTIPNELDEEAEELLEVKGYYDELVAAGRLNEDYSLNKDYEVDADFDDELEDLYEADMDKDEGEDGEFFPAMGEEYWYDGFALDMWAEDLSDHVNLLKINDVGSQADPIFTVSQATGYYFINENLLRQAFTRRAFDIEHGLECKKGHEGCCEELEFLGDSVMNQVVTKEIFRQFSHIDVENVAAPFVSDLKEGDLTKLRAKFVSKEYLAERAVLLGLDKLILYGTGEEPSESTKEDMMEALIGAVCIDCEWDMSVLEDVVNRLLDIQLGCVDELLKKSYYDIFNAWHQKYFGEIPSYEVEKRQRAGGGFGIYDYSCVLRFHVPENDKGIRTAQLLVADGTTRSEARNKAAQAAYYFAEHNGLWINIKNAGIIPDEENAINQLQELYQKKYLEDKPEYSFEEWPGDEWHAVCVCGAVQGWGTAGSKVKAKKKAAFMVLERMMR